MDALTKMRAKLAADEAKLEKMRQARLEAEAAHLRDVARRHLTAAGLSGRGAKHAIAWLTLDDDPASDRPRLAFDDDGNPALLVRKPWGPATVRLEEGLAEWLASDDAKHFKAITGDAPPEGAKPGEAPPRTAEGAVDWSALQARALEGAAEAEVLEDVDVDLTGRSW